MKIVFGRQTNLDNTRIGKKRQQFRCQPRRLQAKEKTFILTGQLHQRYFVFAAFDKSRTGFGVKTHYLLIV